MTGSPSGTVRNPKSHALFHIAMQTPRSWGSLAQDNGLSYFALRVQVIQNDSQESVDKTKEMNGGVIFTGTNHLIVVEGWVNQRGSNIGEDGLHSSVRAHGHHATAKEVEAHKEKQGARTKEIGSNTAKVK